MPTLQRLADNGLMYSQWHTTALCSPTRSCFLTGRNHHQNGMACITEGAIGYPGANAHIPPECGTLAEVMRKAGWSTFWLGKNHNVPVDDLHAGSTKETWPLHQGWDRFYGFLGGETNQWYPDLVDRQPPHRPAVPARGGLPPLQGPGRPGDPDDPRRQGKRPVKPWFTWFCPGANHAPHHAPQEWADKYKGKFDDGYEAYREWVLPRMIAKGVLPEGTELTPMNPMPDGHLFAARRRAPVGLAVGRREEALRPHGRGLRRLLRVHRPPSRPDHRLPGADRAAREHAHLLLRRQRRLRRGQPERLGQ